MIDTSGNVVDCGSLLLVLRFLDTSSMSLISVDGNFFEFAMFSLGLVRGFVW